MHLAPPGEIAGDGRSSSSLPEAMDHPFGGLAPVPNIAHFGAATWRSTFHVIQTWPRTRSSSNQASSPSNAGTSPGLRYSFRRPAWTMK
jgi:hypothetical protein